MWLWTMMIRRLLSTYYWPVHAQKGEPVLSVKVPTEAVQYTVFEITFQPSAVLCAHRVIEQVYIDIEKSHKESVESFLSNLLGAI